MIQNLFTIYTWQYLDYSKVGISKTGRLVFLQFEVFYYIDLCSDSQSFFYPLFRAAFQCSSNFKHLNSCQAMYSQLT